MASMSSTASIASIASAEDIMKILYSVSNMNKYRPMTDPNTGKVKTELITKEYIRNAPAVEIIDIYNNRGAENHPLMNITTRVQYCLRELAERGTQYISYMGIKADDSLENICEK